MYKIVKTKSVRFIFIAIIIFSFISIPALGQPLSEIHEKLIGITDEEKEVLSELFILAQEIEGIEKEEKRLANDIKGLDNEIEKVKMAIAGEEKAFENNKEGLKQVLKSYQRMGPGSYLEIILGSDSLVTLLRRINTLQDITKNTGKLLNLIEENKKSLLNAKEELDGNIVKLEEKQADLEEALSEKLRFKDDMEKYLGSLHDEREYYQEHLAVLEKAWDEVGKTVADTIKELSRIISEEELPLDAVKLSFSLLKIKGTIEEGVFNDILKKQPKLSKMFFKFTPGEMALELPDNNTVLRGQLVIIDGNTLEFKVENGDFYGLPLDSRSVSELFKENSLVLNLKPILGGNKLDSIEIKEGYLELTSTLKFLGRIY